MHDRLITFSACLCLIWLYQTSPSPNSPTDLFPMTLLFLELISHLEIEISREASQFHIANVTAIENISRGHLCCGTGKSGSMPCTWAGLINSNGVSVIVLPSDGLLTLIKFIITREQSHIKFYNVTFPNEHLHTALTALYSIYHLFHVSETSFLKTMRELFIEIIYKP